jgi:hypothetical protein
MRNNGKTSAIDGGGYRSTFDMILSSRVRFFLLLTTDTGFNWAGGLQKSGGGDEGHRRR